MRDPNSVLITGGSSGIGEGLALAYSAPGVFIALTGRDRERLDAVAESCRDRGAEVDARTIDATDRDGLAAWIAEVDAAHPLELVVANAGIGSTVGRRGESAETAHRVFDVNVDGVLNTVLPALEAMRARAEAGAARPVGQIAIMSSLASFRGLPGAPAYSASKAAVRSWGEALRGDVHALGIEVNVICPGFVKSRMTARNEFPMPMLWDTDKAVRRIRKGLARNEARIAFPWPLYLMIWLITAMGPDATDWMIRRSPKKR